MGLLWPPMQACKRSSYFRIAIPIAINCKNCIAIPIPIRKVKLDCVIAMIANTLTIRADASICLTIVAKVSYYIFIAKRIVRYIMRAVHHACDHIPILFLKLYRDTDTDRDRVSVSVSRYRQACTNVTLWENPYFSYLYQYL